MFYISTPLRLSAAGMRMAGYIVESNLRTAQALNRAAAEAIPFMVGTRLEIGTPSTPAATPARTAKSKRAAKPKKPAGPDGRPMPATSRSGKAAPAAAEKTAPTAAAEKSVPRAAGTGSEAPESRAPAATPPADGARSVQAKRPRQPSPPPSMPDAAAGNAGQAKTERKKS